MSLPALVSKLKEIYPGAERDGFLFASIDSALAIKIEGTDVHSSLRTGDSHKDQIDLTYGATLPDGASPVDDFFPTVVRPKHLPQSRHLKISCRVWGGCLAAGTHEWVMDENDVVRLDRNEGRNPSLQLRGIDGLRQLIPSGDWLILVHRSGLPRYEAFSLRSNLWTNPSGRSKEVLFSLARGRVDFRFDELAAAIPAPTNVIRLPKPFLLLAGISGTGKSRFVKEQAKAALGNGLENFCLIPVRPDWHEPSDLLGYVSRISGTKYVSTDFLRFVAKTWLDATENDGKLKDPAEMRPHWLCLDEMNLAPVEQYFADYLSVLETRVWAGDKYNCDPLLKASVLETIKDAGAESENALFHDLFGKEAALGDASHASNLWAKFLKNGISIPPNLIVVGTVNMDETTHGFSRKVIDRALTLDFQEFFPNELDKLLAGGQTPHKTLGFPVRHRVGLADLAGVTADADGKKTVAFIENLNKVLKGTPFELAYRALNELLLAVESFKPADAVALQAVWDDFLMQKVLPRIEGDSAKLKAVKGPEFSASSKLPEPNSEFGNGSVLHQLYQLLQEEGMLQDIWDGKVRPDWLRQTDSKIPCRSERKLKWMMHRLKTTHFTDFWC